MATYYVRPDGNDSNTGLGSTTGLAWKTIQKALGATGIGSGDTIYIAPGTYVEQVTVGGTYSVATSIIGDPLCTQFADVTSAPVRLSAFISDSNAPTFTSNQLVATSKNYLQFSNILFDLGNSTTGNAISLTNCRYWLFEKCAFISNTLANNNAASLYISGTGTTAFDFTINRCIFAGNAYPIYWTKTGSVTDTTKVSNCLFTMGAIINYHTQVLYINNTFNRSGIFTGGNASASFPLGVYNNLFTNTPTGTVLNTSVSGSIVENYNRFIACATPRANVSVGANSSDVGILGVSHGYELLVGLPSVQFFGSLSSTPNANFGTTTNASVSDMFGVTWTGTNPDSGSVTYRNIGAVGQYVPTERNASTITIAPGSTLQSIELYLGATGLTASTSGLTARYNRTRTASVSIPLVARTIAQAWTAGGFAEVDATNMPGVYRLDVPDAALAAGADDVTIVVRGASGTNGAVMTINLKSAGLSEAQTAGAVWNAARASYATAGSFGEYVNADLVSQPGVSVHMGPFEIKADGLGASDPLDIQKGAQHGVDIQCVDGNGNGIDITSATVTAKVYNSGGSLVDTYACTATYAADGRATFTIDTTVTNTPGTYTATITRTTGASDTQVFGPLRIYVRDI